MDEIDHVININTEHPFWDELVNDLTDRTHITTSNLFFRTAFFTRDHVIKFPDICPDVQKHDVLIVTRLLVSEKHFRRPTSGLITRLNEFAELWGFDYTKHNYISICFKNHIYSADVLKYFLDCGSTFEPTHAKYAHKVSEEVLSLMIEHGLNADDLASAYVKKMSNTDVEVFHKLHFFATLNLDMTGHLLEYEPVQDLSDAELFEKYGQQITFTDGPRVVNQVLVKVADEEYQVNCVDINDIEY
jgi:hypothetical protein